MRKDKLARWSWGYTLLRLYTSLVLRFYYKHIIPRGKRNIPRGQPVILASNHQNALMDALVVIYQLGVQPVYLARADIFKKSIIRSILFFLKILPIYRIRDGVENLQENDQVFDRVLNVLGHKGTIGILPEGNHGDKKRLRMMKKGIFRIAFAAQETKGAEPWVCIVPVGLDYSNYQKARQTVIVQFGNPIEVSEYWELYKENPAKAYNALRDDLAERLKPLMIHVEDEQYYPLYMTMTDCFGQDMARISGLQHNKVIHCFVAQKIIIHLLDRFKEKYPGDLDRVQEIAQRYQEGLKKLGTRDWVFRRQRYSNLILAIQTIVLAVSMPVFLYGWINNLAPYHLPGLVSKKIKDLQFISSVNYVLALVVILLFYSLQVYLVSHFTRGWIIPLAYLVSLPLTGLAALTWLKHWKKTRAKWEYNQRAREKNPVQLGAQKDREVLMQFFMTRVLRECKLEEVDAIKEQITRET
jgi:1-acyl-sn-glycerol-3-phosphate acyltransferase